MHLLRTETPRSFFALIFTLWACPAPAQWWLPDAYSTAARVAPTASQPWESRDRAFAVAAPPGSNAKLPSHPLTLAELTEFALQNNPRARQAWAAARAAAAGVGIEQADYLPQIIGSYAVNRSSQVSATSGALIPWQTRYGPGVSLSYVLFDFGARSDQVRSAEFRLLAANLSQNRTLQDIVYQVEQSYYRVLGLDAVVHVFELSLNNFQTALEAARRRRESGLATVADVYRAETQVAQAELNLTRSRGELQKARGQLASAVGLPVNGTLQIQPLNEFPQVGPVTAGISDLLDRAKNVRPDLMAAEAQARAARATASAVSKAGLPSIELSGSASHQMYNDNRQAVSPYAIGLNVRIPIFTGFRDTYSVRQALAQADQAESQRDTLYRQTELDVWQAYYDVQTAAQAVGSIDAQVRSAEQTAQATLARYQGGFGSILDLLTAQVDESNARVQRVQSYLDWFTALARLNFSTGVNDIMAAASDKK